MTEPQMKPNHSKDRMQAILSVIRLARHFKNERDHLAWLRNEHELASHLLDDLRGIGALRGAPEVIEVDGFEETPESLADYLAKVHGAMRNAAMFLEIGARHAPDTAIDTKIGDESLKTRGLATVMQETAVRLHSLLPNGA